MQNVLGWLLLNVGMRSPRVVYMLDFALNILWIAQFALLFILSLNIGRAGYWTFIEMCLNYWQSKSVQYYVQKLALELQWLVNELISWLK